MSALSLTHAHRQFEAALPSIDTALRYQFRRLPESHREEALADARAAAWAAWSGLLRRGKDPLAVGVTGIAANAARYVKNGRKVGNRNTGRGCRDIQHPAVRREHGLRVVAYEEVAGLHSGAWREWAAEDNRVTPAEEVCFRVDFQAWLAGLPARKRRMAELLAQGHGTGAVAKMLGVTPPAVSIARTWLEASWRAFQGETGREEAPGGPRPVGRPRKTGGAARGPLRRRTTAHVTAQPG